MCETSECSRIQTLHVFAINLPNIVILISHTVIFLLLFQSTLYTQHLFVQPGRGINALQHSTFKNHTFQKSYFKAYLDLRFFKS